MDDLLQRCLDGDGRAWDEFVDRYIRVIYAAVSRLAYNHLKNASSQMVDDLVQDVLVKLLRNDMKLLRNFDPSRAKLSTWLTIVARSTTLDFLRKKRIPKESLDDQLKFIPVENPPEPEPPKIDLPEGLLSSRQELVLTMLFDRDMEVQEVAEALDIEPQSVRSTKHKAIKKLREYYDRHGPP